MEETKRVEKARHRKEEEDKLKEVEDKEARRKVTRRAKRLRSCLRLQWVGWPSRQGS